VLTAFAWQDFEDWDDVGINTSKPPGLLKLYRDYNHHVLPKATLHTVGVMTDDVKMNFDVSLNVAVVQF